MQRGWIIGPPSRGSICLPVVTEPTNVSATTAWHYAASAATFFPVLRSLTRRSLVLHHVCVDGGAEASARLLEQYDRAYIEHEFEEPQKTVMLNTSFFTKARCSLHVCGGGLRWSSWAMLPEDKADPKGFLNAVHVGMAAYRKRFSLLALDLTTYLSMVVWRDGADDPSDVEQLWLALGHKPEVAHELRDLNPRVEGEEVVFNDSFRRHRPNVVSRLSFLILTIWHFGDLSDTRFAGMGRPLRSYVGSLLIGTDLIAKLIRAGCRTYHIGASMRVAPIHREFCAVQCIASKVTEDLVHEILKDDRIARRPRFYKATLYVSLRNLEGLPDYVWKRLATASNTGIDTCGATSSRCLGHFAIGISRPISVPS